MVNSKRSLRRDAETNTFATANPFRLRTNPSCVRTCGGRDVCAPQSQHPCQPRHPRGFIPFRSCEFVPQSAGLGVNAIFLLMRYLVKGRVRQAKDSALLRAIEDGILGKGSIAGDEYLYDMEQARVNDQGIATWVETCFCDPPLAEERPYWQEYFELLSVKDAHSRRTCRHENGSEPWACCDCDCTKKLEERLATQGNSFLKELRQTNH